MSHRARTIATATGVLGGAANAVPALSAHVPGLSDRLPIERRLSDPASVALTFDDGPHPQATPRVLDILDRCGVSATFFLVGEQVARHPALAREIVAAGHAIGLHGHTHRCELRLSPWQLREDRRRGLAAIVEATTVTPRICRPPYGAASAAGLVLAGRARMQTTLWSRWGRDWQRSATARSVASDVLGTAAPAGDIVLLHDADHYGSRGCWWSTVRALDQIIAACRRAGLRPVSLRSRHEAAIVTTPDEPSVSRPGDPT